MTRPDWVLVKGESELRVGMCVELRPCVWCNRRERLIISKRKSPTTGYATNPSGIRFSISHAWHVLGRCRAEPVAFSQTIRERRLYRLADEQLDETTTEKRLETQGLEPATAVYGLRPAAL